jgi:hypothetical protein
MVSLAGWAPSRGSTIDVDERAVRKKVEPDCTRIMADRYVNEVIVSTNSSSIIDVLLKLSISHVHSVGCLGSSTSSRRNDG